MGPGELPAELTSFVGRRRDIGEVKRLLGDARLVTLTGIGGTGKTRLALRVAADVRRALPDGGWFVDLTELRTFGVSAGEVEDPDALAHLVAAALGLHDRPGVPPLRRLADHLAGRHAMLVLDNCEHLSAAAAVLADRLLRSCPRLRVIATSREPLGIAGETIYPVSPLPAPPPGRPSPAGLESYESVTLFVSRARTVASTFQLTGENAGAVAEICHRLDGLPLAVELAAARIRVLSPRQILDRLTDRFALLGRGSRTAPARQQTLRACVDWSYDLCSKPERLLWARLSVFVGGFELDAAESVCADESLPADELLDLVAGLVNRSILIRDDPPAGDAEAARYRMLETIRDYGHQELREDGEYDLLHRRHADWCQDLVTQAAGKWISHRQGYWYARLTREHPNLRAAIEYCLDEPGLADSALLLAMTAPLSYWSRRGLFSEVRQWLARTLAHTSTTPALRARALLFASHNAMTQGDTEAATRLLREGEDLTRRYGEPVEAAYASYVRGVVSLHRGDLLATIEAQESTLAILATAARSESGRELELRLCQLIGLGLTMGMAGDHQRSDACLAEVVAISEACGDTHIRACALWGQALSAWRQGRVDATVAALAAGLRLRQTEELPDRFSLARFMETTAWVAAGAGQYARAATLLGAADALWTEIGIRGPRRSDMAGHHETCERQTREHLNDKSFDEASARGRALSYHDAIAYALNEPPRRPAAPAPEEPAPLTRREREVADLVAEGLSNKEIAAALVISTRTAESHVERILAKLGFASRAQVAAWKAGVKGT